MTNKTIVVSVIIILVIIAGLVWYESVSSVPPVTDTTTYRANDDQTNGAVFEDTSSGDRAENGQEATSTDLTVEGSASATTTSTAE